MRAAAFACTAIASSMLAAGSPANAQSKCRGRDLFPELRALASADYQKLEDRAEAFPFRRGLLFRISSQNGQPSYLFGTLHLADPRVTDLFRSAAGLLAKASTVVVESTDVTIRDGSLQKKAEFRDAVFAKPWQHPDRLLDAPDFAALEAMVQAYGLPANSARAFKPGVLALLLDQPSCAVQDAKDRPYLDAIITKAARDAGVPIVGLETLPEQFNAVDGLGPEVERDLLKSVLRNARVGEDVMETQILRYIENDPGALLAFMTSSLPVRGIEGGRTPPAFLDKLLRLRSARMVSRLGPILARGNAFIAVGAAHLPGPDGLAAVLQNAGYQVERLK